MGLFLLVCVIHFCLVASVQHVHFVDQQNNNFLFRGGSPEVNGVFEFETLVSTIRATAAEEKNITLPSDLSVVVINVENLDNSLLTEPKDLKSVLVEHEYFEKYPSAGKFLFWHMVGTKSRPDHTVFDGNREWLAKTLDIWDSDRLVNRSAQLREMMMQKSNSTTVYYFHCDCG